MPLEAMSSIIAIGLLGKLFQILFLHTCLHLDKQLRVISFSLMLQVKLPVGLQVTNI